MEAVEDAMAGLSHKRLVAELSLDELLAHGVEQAETELLHTNGVSTAADTPVAHPARNGKRARSAAGDEVAAAEVSPAEDAVPDSRPFVLFAAPKRRRVEPQPEEGTRVEEPNAAHVVVSDLSGLVPLSEDAPFKSLGLNDWLVRLLCISTTMLRSSTHTPCMSAGEQLHQARSAAANTRAARLHSRCPCRPRRHGHRTDRQWQDSCICAAAAAAIGG